MIKDLKKDYHVLDLQQRIVREIVLQIELLFNNKRKDVKKLKNGKNKYCCRSYFLLVCKEKDLIDRKNEFEFIWSRLNNTKNWFKIDDIKLRPSRKKHCYRIYSFSWEIK